MSDDESLLPAAGGCLFSAIVLLAGISRSNKNNTSAWAEMFNVLKDICLWVFAVLFALFIAYVIYFVIKVTLEKIRGAFVAWDKSESWCNSIETSFQKSNTDMDRFKQQLSELRREKESLKSYIQGLHKELEELKKVTGFNVKEVEASAEDEILRGV